LEQILEVLNAKGETKVLEHKHQYFNAGKTQFDNHKELLFVTKVNG
jgi:adenine-specific DNA-methyltransferase